MPIGQDCKLIILIGGSTPLEATLVTDNDLFMSAGTIEKTSRANEGWKQKRAGLKEWSDDFEMIYDPTDAAWVAFRDAFFAGTALTIQVVDGDGEGIQGEVYVTKFGRPEKLEDWVVTPVTLDGNGKPVWIP